MDLKADVLTAYDMTVYDQLYAVAHVSKVHKLPELKMPPTHNLCPLLAT